MILHKDSHLDHGLTEDQRKFLLDRFADRKAFFIETFTLPRELGTLSCGLYGPTMGDKTIGEDEVEYAPRGTRAWNSRLMRDLPARQQHEVTVVAGPHEETCEVCGGTGMRTDPAPLGSGSTLGAAQPCTCEGGKIRYACILYTVYGGPQAPQEPGDPNCKDPEKSAAFWREHGLAK